MGIEFAHRSFADESEPKSFPEADIVRMVDTVQRLSGASLKTYFEHIFRCMGPQSKEALTELMWSSLNGAEQRRFELPHGILRIIREYD